MTFPKSFRSYLIAFILLAGCSHSPVSREPSSATNGNGSIGSSGNSSSSFSTAQEAQLYQTLKEITDAEEIFSQHIRCVYSGSDCSKLYASLGLNVDQDIDGISNQLIERYRTLVPKAIEAFTLDGFDPQLLESFANQYDQWLEKVLQDRDPALREKLVTHYRNQQNSLLTKTFRSKGAKTYTGVFAADECGRKNNRDLSYVTPEQVTANFERTISMMRDMTRQVAQFRQQTQGLDKTGADYRKASNDFWNFKLLPWTQTIKGRQHNCESLLGDYFNYLRINAQAITLSDLPVVQKCNAKDAEHAAGFSFAPTSKTLNFLLGTGPNDRLTVQCNFSAFNMLTPLRDKEYLYDATKREVTLLKPETKGLVVHGFFPLTGAKYRGYPMFSEVIYRYQQED